MLFRISLAIRFFRTHLNVLFQTVLYLLNFEFTTITKKRKLLFAVSAAHSIPAAIKYTLPHSHRTICPRFRRPAEHSVLISPDDLPAAEGQRALEDFHLMSPFF